MAHLIEITDLGAPELEAYTDLTRAQLQNRRQPQAGLLIAESAKVIESALDAGYAPVSLLMERKKLERHAALLARAGEMKRRKQP